MIRKAIDKTGRPIVLSLSPGPTPLENAAEVSQLSAFELKLFRLCFRRIIGQREKAPAATARRGARSRAPVRAAGAGNHAGHHHRQQPGRSAQDARAGAADQGDRPLSSPTRASASPVPRRDPPAATRAQQNLHRARGLQARHHHRQVGSAHARERRSSRLRLYGDDAAGAAEFSAAEPVCILLRLEFYTDDESRFVVQRSAEVIGVPIDEDGAAEIAMRLRVALHASPTVQFAASATTPRSAPPRDRPRCARPRSRCSKSTRMSTS